MGLAAVIGSSPFVLAVNVLTYHNDNARTGWNAAETLLRPGNVNASAFGKIFSRPVDGYVYAQPLYLSGVPIPGKGVRNVVFVATEHDSVYAFDADDAGPDAPPLWVRSFRQNAPAATIVEPVPSGDYDCEDLVPEIGITATPVIDPSSGTIYVEVCTKETSESGTAYFQRLHALDVSTGAEKLGGPATIVASAPGSGDGSVGGVVTFDSYRQLIRPALLLSRGIVYVASASHCDLPPYHGWVIGFDQSTLAPVATFLTTPDGAAGGVWMSGGGLASDAAGEIFFQTGNGTFDLDAGGRDYGNSIVRVSPTLVPRDAFTPSNQAALNAVDDDLGSGGVLLLPDQPGPHPHLAVAAGKEGTIYLVDRDHLGGHHPDVDDVVQQFVRVMSGSFGTPAYFDSQIYYGEGGFAGGYLRKFSLSDGHLSSRRDSQAAPYFPFPGSTPSVSSSGTEDAIVWVIRNVGRAMLHAFDATQLSQELYDSEQNGARDGAGRYVKFSVPTVVNGKVYVGTQGELDVYGCLPPPAPVLDVPVHALAQSSGLSALVAPDAESRFDWSISNGRIDSGQGTNSISFSVFSAGVAQISVTQTRSSGCSSPTATAAIGIEARSSDSRPYPRRRPHPR